MREIEFRAWDKSKRIMLYPNSPYVAYHCAVNKDGEMVEDRHCSMTWTGDVYENGILLTGESDTIILEQYTGLLDKNGKKIFEGDVLKTDELGWIGKCIYNYDGFMLVDNRGGFSSPSWKECEIIGNVHENTELLK